MPKPVVGITMGDPAGIGPEIVIKALCRPRIHTICHPVVFGTSRFLADLAGTGSTRPVLRVVRHPSEASSGKGVIHVVEIESARRIRIGTTSAASGTAALACLDSAIRYALRAEIDAIVTAPVNKAAIRRAGLTDFVGHTEYLAEKAKARSFAMMFHSQRLKVALVTTHLPLRKVAARISSRKVLSVIELSNEALKKLGYPSPRIGVAGLNPHAGEEKAFGDEDRSIIAPAVRTARRRGIDACGPAPADTLFHDAYNRRYDLVVAMYHDQALAPFKMIAFDKGVNVTLGLPFVRTSVDHGTALDIAGKGIASEQSLVEAIRLAARLAT